MKRERSFQAALLGTGVLFYLFFAWYDGPVICVDTPTYINMESAREPLYPMLLALLRMIFGETAYLSAVVVFQSLLAALAAYALAAYLRRRWSISRLLTVCVFGLPLLVSLLNRFAARRGSMYSNSILTEGIAIPLFLLFFRYLLAYVTEQNKKALMVCMLLSFLLVSTRKQMYFVLVLLLVSIWYREWKNKKAVLLTLAVCMAVVPGGSLLLDLGYNYCLRGTVMTHSSDIRFVATIAFYTADREDGVYIREEEVRELFYEIYDSCEANGYLRNQAGVGWEQRVSHFGDHYDHIQIDTMWPSVNRFVQETFDCESWEMNQKADEIMWEISLALIPHNFSRVLSVFADNFRAGLVTTVAQRNPVLNWYSTFLYLFYFGLLYACFRRGRDKKVVLFSLLTLFSVALNVGLVSLVIFCQTRYTIYNMSLFYSSMLLMIHSIWQGRSGGRRLKKL